MPPLLELINHFSHAERLMLSTRSNVGAFLLAWWPAANGNRMPSILDMDGSINSSMMHPDRIYCDLPYGSRHGWCDGRGRQMGLLDDIFGQWTRKHPPRGGGLLARRDVNCRLVGSWTVKTCCQENTRLPQSLRERYDKESKRLKHALRKARENSLGAGPAGGARGK